MKVLSDRERLRDLLYNWYWRTEALADILPPCLRARALTLLYSDKKGTPNDAATEEQFREILREIHGRPRDKAWPTQARVARGLGVGRMEVRRLIDRKELSTNGEKRHKCRVDPASVLKYCEKHGIAYNDDDGD
jgi:hypothetical protein